MSDPAREFEHRFSAFLAQLAGIDVEVLLGVLEPLQVEAGAEVITQNLPSDRLMLVDSGSLDVRIAGSGVATVGPGDVVGEVGLLAPGPATATVVASEPSRLLALSRPALDELWSSHPGIASALLHGVTRVISERIREVEGDIDRLEQHGHSGLFGLLGRLFRRAA